MGIVETYTDQHLLEKQVREEFSVGCSVLDETSRLTAFCYTLLLDSGTIIENMFWKYDEKIYF